MTTRHRLARLALLFCLSMTPAASAFAQEPPPAEGEEKGSGRSLDGYFAMGILAFVALAAVAKSARRN